ncbi:hypothetical protein CVH13_00905 [Dehalococcoides mccartyi]|uniref:Uncharacterized protein n=1 Tax=Dehalococcoides mccartyi TaxID=61435 RepID=A0A2J1DXE5_9CHLR|nr:hypothetical protein CVH13_00905 [Dehalococcoides mccartyi]
MEKEKATNTKKFQIKTRKFSGQRYALFDWCGDLDETKLEIATLRNEGKLVRYSQNTNGYSIWIRK